MLQLSRICRGKSPDVYCPTPTLCQDQETGAFDLGGGIFCSSLFLSFNQGNVNGVVRCILFSKIGVEGRMKNRAREERLGVSIAVIWEAS